MKEYTNKKDLMDSLNKLYFAKCLDNDSYNFIEQEIINL